MKAKPEVHQGAVFFDGLRDLVREPDLLAYSISKGALMTVTRNPGDTLMREEGIWENQVNPGWVPTESETRASQKIGMKESRLYILPLREYCYRKKLKPSSLKILLLFMFQIKIFILCLN